MAKTVVYGNPASTFVRAVRMALEEKGVPYTVEPSDPNTPEQFGRHPFGKVPAFESDGVRLFESRAICRYIDENFAGPALQPADKTARARMDQWISATSDYLYTNGIRRMVLPYVRAMRSKSAPDQAAIDQAKPDVKANLMVFDRALGESRYLAGETVSMADLFLLPIVFYLANFVPEKEELMADRPNLRRWLGDMSKRPSFAKTMPPI